MASTRINIPALKQWSDGEVLHGPDYNGDRSLVSNAINDHATDLENRYTKSEVDSIIITREKIANGSVDVTKIDTASLDARYAYGTALETHKLSGDHDGRYYTQAQTDDKFSNYISAWQPQQLGKMYQLYQSITLASASSTVTLNIPEYNATTDFIQLSQNGMLIKKGVDYSVSSDGKTITKLSGQWTLPTTLDVTILKALDTSSVYQDGRMLQDGSVSKAKFDTAFQNEIGILSGNCINVKSSPYNCKGDGVTNDTAGIQQAINDAYTQKKPVFFPSGNYYVTASLSIPRFITLLGTNNLNLNNCVITSTATKVFVGTTPGTASSYFVTTVDMRNLGISGSGSSAILFDFMQLDESTIENCWIYNFNYVINGNLTNVSNIHHNRFLNIYTSLLSTRLGTVKNTMVDSRIHHNYIDGTNQGNAILIDLEYGNYSDIHNNFMDFANIGVRLDAGSMMMKVNDNMFDVCYNAISMASGAANEILGNTFGKCSKSDVSTFSNLSTANQTTYSSNNWIGIKLGAGVNNLAIKDNVAYKSDVLLDMSSSGYNNISTNGNVNSYSTGVIVNMNRSMDYNNPNESKNLNIGEMQYKNVTSLPSTTAGSGVNSFIGHFVWYNGKLACQRSGVQEVDSLNVTAGATTSGNVTVTLAGTAFNVAVSAGDSASTVASKIASASYSGWSTSLSGTTVTFTFNVPFTRSAPSFSGGTTGVTGTMSVTATGTMNYWSDTAGVTLT
jgi:hypothetical protein